MLLTHEAGQASARLSHPGDAGCHEEQKMGPEQSQTPLPGQSKSEERYYGAYDNFAAAGSL